MKKITLIVLLALLAQFSYSQDCNIGNSDGSDPNFTTGNFTANYLLGVGFTLSQVGVLHALNMIGNGNGSNFQMAIYDDMGGVPNSLVANTNISTVGTGIVSLPVAPVQLEAGDYWIMAVYENDGNHSNVNQNSLRSPVYYTELPFGNPMPTNASGFLTYDGQDFLYFATISCGGLSTDNFEETNISVFPNPAADFISIANLKENKTFIIYDVSGKKLLEKELSTTDNQIDISQLATGTYFLNYGSGAGVRLIKN